MKFTNRQIIEGGGSSPLPIETQSDDRELNRLIGLELSNFGIHHHGLSQSAN